MAETERFPWVNLGLFALTIASTMYVGAELVSDSGPALRGWVYAVPLMLILLTHELGHWLLARKHRVDASLPYFLPLPIGIGTLGAVIKMPERIRSRNALLDIGAAGPLAGMAIAVPVLIIGLRLSTVEPLSEHGVDEGQSLLYLALKWIVVGPIPDGHDVFLHPTAFAGWTGLLLTMFNLIPVGQLDGGHVAYALFGEAQNRYSRRAHSAMLGVFLVVAVISVARAFVAHAQGMALVSAFFTGANWLGWWILLTVLTRWTSFQEHPPTEPGELTRGRRIVGWCTLGLFVLVFMPVPLSSH